jgi:hypothetical protein
MTDGAIHSVSEILYLFHQFTDLIVEVLHEDAFTAEVVLEGETHTQHEEDSRRGYSP